MKTSISILVLLLESVFCTAGVIVVKQDGSGDYSTIQAAVDAANTGDVIEVLPGTYTGNGNRDIDFKGKAITVRSIDPNDPDVVAATIIDCEGTESSPHRGFFFYRGEGIDSILAGLTITNGCVNRGGGIYCHNTSPTITHCNITGNTAYYATESDGGGGIYCLISGSLIADCMITGNTAQGNADGGAIYCSYTLPSPTVVNCFISGNSGDRGGGLFNCEGPITNCTIVNNAAYCGGGLHSCDGPITNCIISGNSGKWTGGLDYCMGPISKCVITGNSATVWGGAGLGWCHTTITNCIITGNSSSQWGGGIYGSEATVKNCIIVGNSAGVFGGGICLQDYEQMTLTNCIIWNNESPQGPQIALTRNVPVIFLNYCDVEGGKSTIYDHNGLSLNWGIGNIDDDPCFVDPGYWNSNDTPDNINDDFWVDGDYHLMSEGWRWHRGVEQWTWDKVTSRCVDAGNPGMFTDDEPTILEVDPLNRFGKNIRVNIGAYGGTAEASLPPYGWTLLPDLTNNGVVDLEDFAVLMADWQKSGDQQYPDFNYDNTVDIRDMILLAGDWLERTSWAQSVLY